MDEQIRKALADQILASLLNLGNLDPASEEYQRAVDSATKLYHLGLDDIKSDVDYDEIIYQREAAEKKEESENVKSAKDEKKDLIETIVKYSLDGVGIVLPMIFYSSWMRKGLEFEKDGTFTSVTFRNLFNRFKPTNRS